jgi:hypothetical protein
MLSARIAAPPNSIIGLLRPLADLADDETMSFGSAAARQTFNANQRVWLFLASRGWPSRVLDLAGADTVREAPNAPCVDVCRVAATTVIPGSVAPFSGPITCTMPWRFGTEAGRTRRAEFMDIAV